MKQTFTVRRPRGWWVVCAVCALAMGCEPYTEPLPRRDRLHFPIGVAVHPTGEYVYVVNSNFDSRYNADYGGTVSVVDTNTLELLPDSSPYIPSYGAKIKLNEDSSRAYVTARQGDAVVALDVGVAAGAGLGSALTCPSEEGGRPSSDPTRCVLSRVPDTTDGAVMPADPFGLEVTTVSRTGEDGEALVVDVLSLSHISSDNVTAISLPGRDLSAATLRRAGLIEGGANAIARRPGTLEMYVAGRTSNQITVFVPYLGDDGEVEALFARRRIPLNNVTNNVDARGIAFDASGEQLYVTTRRPDALHIFTLGPGDIEQGSGLNHELERVIPLGDQPSGLAIHEEPGGRRLVLVPCYDAQTIQVIDPATGVLVREIELDESPYDIALDATPYRCAAPGRPCRGYVSLFADSARISASCDQLDQGCGSVAVLELDPASPRYLQMIAKIR